MTSRTRRSFVVVGLGAFGGTVATALSSMGDEVLGIDADERRLRQYADKLTHSIIADATDEEALREAGVAQHDVAIVAIGRDLEANILCTMNVKLLGVPTIWVKAQSRTHHRILARIGVDRVIQPERDMGMHVAETLHTPFVADYVSLGNGFYVINIVLPENLSLASFAELSEPAHKGLKFLGLMRGSEYLSCASGDTKLMPGDRVLVLGRRDELRTLAGVL